MRLPFANRVLPALFQPDPDARLSRSDTRWPPRAMILDWMGRRDRAFAVAVLVRLLLLLLGACGAPDPNERVTGECKLLISQCSSRQSVIAATAADRAKLASLTDRDFLGLDPERAARAVAARLRASGYQSVTHVSEVGLVEATAESVVASPEMRGLRAVLGGGGPLTAGDDHAETRALVLVTAGRSGAHLHTEFWRTTWDNRGNSKTAEVTDPAEYAALYDGAAGGGASEVAQAAAPEELRADGGRRTGGCSALHGLRRCSSEQVVFDPSPAARQALDGMSLGWVRDDLPEARARAAAALTAMNFNWVEAEDHAGIVRAERDTVLATRHQRMIRGILPKALALGAHVPITGPVIGRPDHETLNAVVVLASAGSGTNIFVTLRQTVWDSKGDANTRSLTDPQLYGDLWQKLGAHRVRG